MMRRVAALLLSAAAALALGACGGGGALTQQEAPPPATPPPSAAPSWELLWQDDFAQAKLDTSTWSYAERRSPDWARYCAGNASTTFVEDGRLHLRGLRTRTPADTARYQTGCVETKGGFSFTYGKLEVRAKLDGGAGAWPAIWLMPQEGAYGGWPRSGEIDVMERLNTDPFVYQTVHSAYTEEERGPEHFATAPIQQGAFNTYGVAWYPGRLDFFVNGRKTFSYARVEGAGTAQWPFDRAFYIILDQALGGAWVGDVEDEDLPAEMVVDWVKVYQQTAPRQATP